MYKYRFSIFTATYNRALMLDSLAEMINHQTFKGSFEWVIVNDGSTDNQDLEELGFNHTKREAPGNGGRPSYDPSDILKLLIYGYFNSIRSSRKLARECVVNIEVRWLLSKVTPDFRTVSDFRKDILKPIKKVFKSLNKQLDSFGLFSHSYLSIDGSKFKAVNSKDNNFTLAVGRLNDWHYKGFDLLLKA